jgi:hypothetical protein
MSPWLLLFIVAAAKIPIAALMLWLPFRSDKAMQPDEATDGPSDGDDGGIKAPPSQPREPHPRGPLGRPRQRGPHGTPASPLRVRLASPRRRPVAR